MFTIDEQAPHSYHLMQAERCTPTSNYSPFEGTQYGCYRVNVLPVMFTGGYLEEVDSCRNTYEDFTLLEMRCTARVSTSCSHKMSKSDNKTSALRPLGSKPRAAWVVRQNSKERLGCNSQGGACSASTSLVELSICESVTAPILNSAY